MKSRLLTFGDSNTHGTRPITGQRLFWRFGAQTRWPTVAHRALGPGWSLVEEGLPGRTTQFPDPVMGAHMDGREGLKIALASHLPVDALTIMLGTNDCKTRFGATPETIVAGLAGLLDIARSAEMHERHPSLRILLIAPPAIREEGPAADEFIGAREKSRALPPLIHALARARGTGFFDAGTVIESCPEDGIHFSASSHRTLGADLAKAVAALG